jgi:Right handed beta helix region
MRLPIGMHRLGPRQRLDRLWRDVLVGVCVAGLGVALTCGIGTAAPARQVGSAPVEDFCASRERGRILHADPANYRTLLARLTAGDTLFLAPGAYRRLTIADIAGAPGRCIAVTGPATGPRAVIGGEIGYNTVEIIDSSYVVVSNLIIDSRGIPGANGLKAPVTPHPATHHIVLDGNIIVGAGANQQNDGISTKTPTWNWIIRRNIIVAAGTAIYLGDSDGNKPFVAGIIENNLALDPVGYGMEIKYQRGRPALAGMPEGPQSTIIRNNVFIKDDRPSPDGNRPNLLVGGFPDTGPGSRDLYQIYGNLFVHNPREALFQGSGRISFHDNILFDGQYAAAAFRDHDLPLELAHIYNNTIYSSQKGIWIGSHAREGVDVVGNLVFAATPISGVDVVARDNLVAAPADASRYVTRPALRLGQMDFFPRSGAVRGAPLDLSSFAEEIDFDRDFNGLSKGARVFRGAYAGEGTNPGWRLRAQIKP